MKNYFAKGDEVLSRWGRATIVQIEYAPTIAPDKSFPVDAVMIADCVSDNWIFTFGDGHFAYANQISPLPVATEITPEQALHAMDSTWEDAQ